jgi:hypothetical protein
VELNLPAISLTVHLSLSLAGAALSLPRAGLTFAAARATTLNSGVLRLSRLHLIRELSHDHVAGIFFCRIKS